MPNLRQIAAIVASDREDIPEAGEITGVSSLDRARPSDAVFAEDQVALERAIGTAAGCILAREQDAARVGDPRVIAVRHPRYAFSVLAQQLGTRPQGAIHVTAVLGINVKVGKQVSIGAGCVIGDNVVIGEGTSIDARVTVYEGVQIGARCLIQSGAVLGSLGFGYAQSAATGEYVRFPQQGALIIEDDVEIGANTTIDRGALEQTRIGRGSKLDNLVHIGHNCIIGRNVVIAAQTGISGSSVIEDGAILGGQVGIGEHATVGDHVILGGGAGVLSGKKLRGANQVFWGRPAQPLKQYLRDLARLRRL
jgi:UDP-3-O-[3-hydroxymyristoyl] glucosamine N-acyltransferase